MALETRSGIFDLLDFIDQTPVPTSDLDYFGAIPHLNHYIHDPQTNYKAAAFISVYRKPGEPSADLFFARTIASEDTVPHRLLLLRKGNWDIPSISATDENKTQGRPFPAPETPEVILLYDLRDGMNGFPHTAHGGSMCALLDETLGMCAEIYRQTDTKREGGKSKTTLYTAQLNVSFLAPVRTPGVVRVRAWMVGREGRKWRLRAQMDDGQGKVLLETESLWISTRDEGAL
jgi:hypothetical protein